MPVTHVSIDGPVATVTLDHPTGNRINSVMREELLDAFQRITLSRARVLVIRAEGDDFCLGGDIRDRLGVSVSQLRPKGKVFTQALDQLEHLPIPTIAVVQGRCLGGGFELVLSCDLILAGQSAQFGSPEAFLGESVDADELARLGLVNCIVPNDWLHRRADDLAQRLTSGPTRAYAVSKALLRAWAASGISSAKHAIYDVSMSLFDSEDV